MELKDFIETALIDIVSAIDAAKSKTSDKIAIAPGRLEGKAIYEVDYISFDLAVSAFESKEDNNSSNIGVRAGINVLGNRLEAGSKGVSSDSDKKEIASLNRIQFKIPICYSAKL